VPVPLSVATSEGAEERIVSAVVAASIERITPLSAGPTALNTIPGRGRRRRRERLAHLPVASQRTPGPPHHSRRAGTMGVMALNRAGRLLAAIDRDGPTCISCGRELTGLVTPTTEHVVPRVKGGPSWVENEVAACRRCNSARGHTGPVEWLEECERRGWRPDEDRLLRALTRLVEAIAREGGRRRARPYLDAQLRRLRRRAATSGTGANRRSVAS
jgi:5-methylcytosine-specific restriction endonuclease McrA